MEENNARPRVGRPRIVAGYGISTDDEGLLDWSHVTEQMTSARNYWIGTTRADGRPHAVPVWGLWIDDALYFSTDPASVKGRNLAARPDVVAHLESGDDMVSCEGRAERVSGVNLPAPFVDLYEAKYGVRVDATDPDSAFFRIRPRLVLAWHEQNYPQSATRWVLGEN